VQGWTESQSHGAPASRLYCVAIRSCAGLSGRRQSLTNALWRGTRVRIFLFRVAYRFRTCRDGIASERKAEGRDSRYDGEIFRRMNEDSGHDVAVRLETGG